MIVVSLTSWPKRIGNVLPVLKSIVGQEMKPDHVELNLSIDEFPQKEDSLPTVLMEFLTSNPEISINWVEGNDGVFKKIIPTLKKYYGKEYYLLSIDDDWIYRKDYIRRMVEYIGKSNGDSFCLSKSTVIGNRIIYKSLCFSPDFWEKLTKDVINSRIDDMYIEHYLRSKGKHMTCYRPEDTKELTVPFNPVHPNSHNTESGQYSRDDMMKAYNLISKIKF